MKFPKVFCFTILPLALFAVSFSLSSCESEEKTNFSKQNIFKGTFKVEIWYKDIQQVVTGKVTEIHFLSNSIILMGLPVGSLDLGLPEGSTLIPHDNIRYFSWKEIVVED
jgi:hypothetical protein